MDDRQAPDRSDDRDAEWRRLREANRSVREERSVLKNHGLLRQRADARDQVMEVEKAHHKLALLARAIKMARSGFYGW